MKTQNPLIVDNVRAWLSHYESDVMQQAARTSRVAAVHGHVALMPDAHWGNGASIGSVIPTVEAIIPSAVGVDIGCGVVAARVQADVPDTGWDALYDSDLPDDLVRLIGQWAGRIPAGVGKGHAPEREERNVAWEEFRDAHGIPVLWDEDQRIRENAPRQMGSLGSGNHFLELCVEDRDYSVPGDEQPQHKPVWLMLHSGSRGPGNRLAQAHIERAKGYMAKIGEHLEDPELAYVVQGTPEFEDYITDLIWAQSFARANRDAMLKAALAGLEAIIGVKLAFTPHLYINNHHNYAALEEHGDQQLWITRKGAIRARAGDLGVVPGSMGTGSYIVRGLGNPESYQSASHGAGRRMSRSKAKKRYSEADMERQMKGVTWQSWGAKGLLDEIPGAYKDLDDVMALQVDLVEPVFHLRTLANYKGIEKGRW